ncbi:MAG: IS110 family transposase, partial [Acidimicrobiia bacterium]|nr:IS110 family transposase [Acidimicrobiia bacterium]
IGIDPHKGSHTAVALDEGEAPLGELRVRSAANQVEQLMAWAAPLGERTWAIEGAGGLGYLLAQQLVAAGERVVDVQPKLAARVRLLATGASNKNDPNDARSVAVAALRATVPEVRVEDHAAVMKVWAKRHRDLSRQHNRVACRLHSVLCDLAPGGIAGEISPAQATRLLDGLEPVGAVATARHELAVELVADLVRLDTQRRDARRRIVTAVTASKTTLTELFGVGPIVAATVIGEAGDVSRFPTRDRFAAYNGTAPIEVSSGGRRKVFRLSRRGNRCLNHVIHMAAVTQIRYRHTNGRAFYDRKIAEGHSGKEALRALKRRISDAIYARLRHDAEQAARVAAGPGGHTGNGSVACAAGSHPEHRLFDQATPGPDSSLRPARTRADAPTSKPPTRRPRKAS